MESIEVVCLCDLLVHLVDVAEHLLVLVEVLRELTVVLLCTGDVFLHYQVLLHPLLLQCAEWTVLRHDLLSRALDHLLEMGDALPQLHQLLALRFLLQGLHLLYHLLEQGNHLVVGLAHYCRFTHAQLLLLPSEGVHHFH